MIAPRDEAELAEIVREAAAKRSGLEIVGGGTKLGIGHPVAAAQRISTRGISGITLYEPASLTLVARAGTPLNEIEAALAAENQFLPFEPADWRGILGSSGEPTIGGIYCAGVSGPRRIQAGAARDSAIGVRFVSGSGEIAKSGGRVMKNVTGYDLVKLLCGAYGTLGIVTEIALKLLPAPETTATLVIEGLDDAAAIAALSWALGSPFGVSGAAHVGARTCVRLEGLSESVAYRATRLRETLGGEIKADPARNAALWKSVRDVEAFTGRPGTIWRVSLKPTDGPAFVASVRRSIAAEALYDWGGGLVWLLVPAENDAGAATIRAELKRFGGHATLFRASEATRRAVPVFQPEAPGISAISAGLRRQFDPAGVLNPGRMVADVAH